MWAIILHGGAKAIEAHEIAAEREGCAEALECGTAILREGGSALEAVESSIREMESNPTFNAGRGSARNSDGEIEMCAAIMEGTSFNVGAVTVIKRVRHPIGVARLLLPLKEILLAADGALRFAIENGCELVDQRQDQDGRAAWVGARSHDTVGCVALDEHGRMAVGTSTGGLEGSRPGRVGDSPQPGCGFYVDDDVGGVALSGDGEHIARKIAAARIMESVLRSPHDIAIAEVLREVRDIGGEAGGIFLSKSGEFAWDHNSRDFAVALQRKDMPEPRIFTNKSQAI